MKTRLKKAFSMMEAMIILALATAAIAAAVPFFTKKSVNSAEAGAVLSGDVHGRYEAFTKELISFNGSTWLERKIDTSKPDPGNNITVYRRLDNTEYINTVAGIRGSVAASNKPAVSSDGYKEMLYEQITDARAFSNPAGQVTHVQFVPSGETQAKKFPIGGDIIVENPNLCYVETDINGVRKSEDCSYPKNDGKIRIIESNIANFYAINPKNTSRKLYHVSINSGDNKASFKSIPWYRLYSGKKLVKEGKIETKAGKTIATFDPGKKAKNVVIHMVGGGGAGGNISNAGKVITPANASTTELEELKKELTAKFNAHFGTNYAVNDIVKVVNVKNLATNKDKLREHLMGDNSKYILLNQADGTITVKFDVRKGKHAIGPHELLSYTNKLGSDTQKEVTSSLPKWGWDEIYNRGFYAAAVGIGGPAGDGADYNIDTTSITYSSKQAIYCPFKQSMPHTTSCCPVHSHTHDCYRCASYGSWTNSATGKTQYYCEDPRWDKCCCDHTYYAHQCRYYNRSNGFFTCFEVLTIHYQCYSPPCGYSDGECPRGSGTATSKECTHKILGGKGGNAGGFATACTKVSKPIELRLEPLAGANANKKGKASPSDRCKPGSTSITAQDGGHGQSYWMQAGEHYAISEGGTGGLPCAKNLANYEPNAYEQAKIIFGGRELGPTYDTRSMSMSASDSSRIVLTLVGNYYDRTKQKEAEVRCDESTVDKTPTCGSSWNCDPEDLKGDHGFAINSCEDDERIGICMDSGMYNYIYAWTMPYAVNKLAYGEGGLPGQYITTKLNNVQGEMEIELGKGGYWTSDTAISATHPTDTIIKIKPRNEADGPTFVDMSGTVTTDDDKEKDILQQFIAKAGINGISNKQTNRFILAYEKDTIEKDGSNSTKDILRSSMYLSAFEGIRSLVQNSEIVGIGLGRGGEGFGSISGTSTTKGLRNFVNITGCNLDWPNNSVLQPWGDWVSPSGDTKSFASYFGEGDYANKKIKLDTFESKGGDGAVIIAW